MEKAAATLRTLFVFKTLLLYVSLLMDCLRLPTQASTHLIACHIKTGEQ